MPDKGSRARHRLISRFFRCRAPAPRGVVREGERAARRCLRGPLEDIPLQIADPGGSGEPSSRRAKHSFFVSFLFRPALVVAMGRPKNPRFAAALPRKRRSRSAIIANAVGATQLSPTRKGGETIQKV